MIMNSKPTRRPSVLARTLLTLSALLLLAVYPTLARAGGEAGAEKTITYSAQNIPVEQALREVARQSGINVAIRPETDLSARVTVEVEEAQWLGVLEAIGKIGGVELHREGDIFWVSNASAKSVAKEYTGEPVSMSLQQAPVDQVLESFAVISGMPIVLADGVEGAVTVEFKAMPWDQALDAVLELQGLSSELVDGTLKVFPAGS